MQWLLQKLRCSYHVINKVKEYHDKSSLLTLYHSLINSYVQYCVISWCHGNVSMIQKLQKVSTKAINTLAATLYFCFRQKPSFRCQHCILPFEIEVPVYHR